MTPLTEERKGRDMNKIWYALEIVLMAAGLVSMLFAAGILAAVMG